MPVTDRKKGGGSKGGGGAESVAGGGWTELASGGQFILLGCSLAKSKIIRYLQRIASVIGQSHCVFKLTHML